MDRKIIALSGPPASGKNAVTDKLCSMSDSQFVYLKKYRTLSDSKNKPDYINVSDEEFAKK